MSSSRSDIRYARQIRYPAIGRSGQNRLMQAHAAIVGLGALGCVIANHLARAGVGKLTLIDRDIVDHSNLQRQLLFDEADAEAGAPKAAAAAKRLASVNGDIELLPYIADLSSYNAESLLSGADIVLDGSDNFNARYLMNEFSVKHGIPWIYGGAVASSGMSMTIRPGVTPCFACMFPDAPPGGAVDTCETAGVLAPIVDTVGSVQSMEAIKLLTGSEQALHGSLLQIDLWTNQWHSIGIASAKKPDCPVCARREFDLLEGRREETLTASLCGRNTVQVSPSQTQVLDLSLIAGRWDSLGKVEINAYLLRLHRTDGLTFVLFPDGRALVMGTDDSVTARRIYTELMGE
ncbi:thiamine biosynthesis protein ThiF [Cohnella kolymensis]|uniref:Thiamine biosynthesis protein ThiF n=1 Tax=Cohnella kolymensis TaxID=1590652 RepID=A0ABR5A7J5_9BACL|nr:ThiF family adenylyltransferase [Cohnella kolymensis]KIL36773.1 thiamine biosynthesis protein ThiF [Cohnella kolymensis]